MRRRTLRLLIATLGALVTLASAGVASPAPGGSPNFSATPDPLDFGSVAVGSSSTLPLTITNTGTEILPHLGILGTFRGGPDRGAWTVPSFGACPPVGGLAPGLSCSLSVNFRPTKKGKHRSTLVLDDAFGGSASITVTGIGA